MKNIRIYSPKKYDGKDYKKVKENIYETIVVPKQSDNSLALKGVSDDNLVKILRDMDNWKECENEIEEDLLYVIYNGKKYYKEIDDEEEVIFENESDDESQIAYVTSIMFEQEPEFGENDPTNPMISQYPLEDILEKFNCYCYDDYTEENKKNSVNSYIEFAGDEIEDIENLLTIVGKHVYNIEDGEYVKLIIE